MEMSENTRMFHELLQITLYSLQKNLHQRMPRKIGFELITLISMMMHLDVTDQQIRETRGVIIEKKEAIKKTEDIAKEVLKKNRNIGRANTARQLQDIERKKREPLKRKAEEDAANLIKRAKAAINEKRTALPVPKCIENVDFSVPPPSIRNDFSTPPPSLLLPKSDKKVKVIIKSVETIIPPTDISIVTKSKKEEQTIIPPVDVIVTSDKKEEPENLPLDLSKKESSVSEVNKKDTEDQIKLEEESSSEDSNESSDESSDDSSDESSDESSSSSSSSDSNSSNDESSEDKQEEKVPSEEKENCMKNSNLQNLNSVIRKVEENNIKKLSENPVRKSVFINDYFVSKKTRPLKLSLVNKKKELL